VPAGHPSTNHLQSPREPSPSKYDWTCPPRTTLRAATLRQVWHHHRVKSYKLPMQNRNCPKRRWEKLIWIIFLAPSCGLTTENASIFLMTRGPILQQWMSTRWLFVTFLSPSFGGHEHRLWKGHVNSPSQKRAQRQNCLGDVCSKESWDLKLFWVYKPLPFMAFYYWLTNMVGEVI